MKVITDARVMQELGTIRADVDSVKTELAAKSAVKSVQRGSASLSNASVVNQYYNTYVDVVISEVNVSNCFVTAKSRGEVLPHTPNFSARLVSGTTLRVQRDKRSLSPDFIVDWEVIEYA